MTKTKNDSCEKCFFHVSGWADDGQCMCKESPKYEDITGDEETCICFEKRVDDE